MRPNMILGSEATGVAMPGNLSRKSRCSIGLASLIGQLTEG
jgi:hypothetical protein